jgi:hypothetical protein
MSRYPERQLNLPGFVKLSPPWIGLRDVIAHGTLAKLGVAPSVRELAAALVVDETKIRSIVDSMIENGVAVEQGGVLFCTDWEPGLSKPRPWPARMFAPITPTPRWRQIARYIKRLHSTEAENG